MLTLQAHAGRFAAITVGSAPVFGCTFPHNINFTLWSTPALHTRRQQGVNGAVLSHSSLRRQPLALALLFCTCLARHRMLFILPRRVWSAHPCDLSEFCSPQRVLMSTQAVGGSLKDQKKHLRKQLRQTLNDLDLADLQKQSKFAAGP